MGSSFHTEQWLPQPVETVFDFFADPDNLPSLMPAWQKARIEKKVLVQPVQPHPSGRRLVAAAGTGSRITISFRPFRRLPLRVRWVAEIVDFSWNHHFCDQQIRGPFGFWKHCHYLRSVDKRGGADITLVVDDVEYEMPFGFLGDIVHKMFVRRHLEDAFAHRQARTAEVLGHIRQGSVHSPVEQPQTSERGLR